MNHTRIYSLQGCGDWVYNHFLSTKLQRWRWWTPKASSIPSWFFLWKGGRQKHLAIFQITEFQMKPDTSYIKTSFNVNQNCSACTARIFFIKCPRLKGHCSLRNDILFLLAKLWEYQRRNISARTEQTRVWFSAKNGRCLLEDLDP